MSYKIESRLPGHPHFHASRIRFATAEEAEACRKDLSGRWLLPADSRITTCDDPVNYRWVFELGRAFPLQFTPTIVE